MSLSVTRLALRTTAWGELDFSELVFDQPKAQFVVVISVCNRDIRICSACLGLVPQRTTMHLTVSGISSPELQPIAMVKLIGSQRLEVVFDVPENFVRSGMMKHRKEKIDVCRLRTGHVVKEGVITEWVPFAVFD